MRTLWVWNIAKQTHSFKSNDIGQSLIDIGRLVNLSMWVIMTHCIIDENLASITAGEAMLHCVRNNNKNLNDSHSH